MLWLHSARIRKFRALSPETSLEFGRGPVFLLGRNGSGKSTLLELLGRLAALDVASLVQEDEELDITWEIAWDVPGLGTYALESRLQVGEEATLLPELVQDARKSWQWEGKVYAEGGGQGRDDGREMVFTFRTGYPLPEPGDNDESPTRTVIIWPRDFAPGLEERQPAPSASYPSFIPLLARLTHDVGGEEGKRHDNTKKALGRLGELTREAGQLFDESLGTFQRIFSVGDPPHDHVKVIGFPARDRSGGTQFQTSFVPLEVLERERFESSSDSGPVTLDSGAVEGPAKGAKRMVEQLRGALGARSVELSTRMVEKDRRGHRHWHRFTLDVYWPPDDTMHNHDRLSFGQKRLVAFLWYQAVMAERPLFCDELTNGLHATWVDPILVDRLEGRQVFHAVQNPLLLDRTGPGEVAEIPGRFVLCDVHGEDHRYWRWRNPDSEEATSLGEAWDAGYESLSELLLNLGLW